MSCLLTLDPGALPVISETQYHYEITYGRTGGTRQAQAWEILSEKDTITTWPSPLVIEPCTIIESADLLLYSAVQYK